MRPTSSTRSSLIETSLVARQSGTVTENTPGAVSVTPNSRRFRICAHFVGRERRGPACAPASRAASSIGGGGGSGRYLIRHAAHQANAGRDLPQQFDRARQSAHRIRRDPAPSRTAWRRRCAASARTTSCGRCDAWKFALSSTMRVVPSPIALSSPPITPASAIGAACIGDHQVRRDSSRILSSFSAANASPASRGRGRRSCRRAACPHRTRASAAPVPP